VLSPGAEPRLQTLLWEDALPPSALLARASTEVASWTRRWDDEGGVELSVQTCAL
jgi:hypothetical protein